MPPLFRSKASTLPIRLQRATQHSVDPPPTADDGNFPLIFLTERRIVVRRGGVFMSKAA
jgi:hypothetical protein